MIDEDEFKEYLRYESASWDQWEDAMINGGPQMGSLPSPKEIEDRARMIAWMSDMKLNSAIVSSTMQKDHPRFDLVIRMVRRHGPRKANRLLLDLMEE
jgi:hypothetical protein